MKWPEMGYFRAHSLDELWYALKSGGSEAQLLAGGQSLLAGLAFRLSQPSALIDMTGIEALKGIAVVGDHLRIGALTTHAELGRSSLVATHAPMLKEAAPLIAHPAIRNRGTIGGSLALADPAAELPACAVALEAKLVLLSERGERKIAAGEFFRGLFETALDQHEIVAAVELPCIKRAGHQTIVEITRRSGDYAMAGLALSLAMSGGLVTEARPVFFGVGSAPVLAESAAAAIIGNAINDATILTAQAALEHDLDPPADMHGGPQFKRHLAKVLIGRALNALNTPKERVA